MNNITPILIKKRIMKPHKSSISPELCARNVLTSSHWDFVELWLKRNEKDEALFYWNQAKIFNQASLGLPSLSAPLLHYYSFMNAAKALLSSKGVSFSSHHGVCKARGDSYTNTDLSTIGVHIKNSGITPSISNYFCDEVTEIKYSLRDLFYNLPYIHRTYCLTYQIENDMFIPIKNAQFVRDAPSGNAFFIATLSKDFSYDGIAEQLPDHFQLYGSNENREFNIRSSDSIECTFSECTNSIELDTLSHFHKRIRKDLFYINGTETLWYIKGTASMNQQIKRSPITITLAAMHCLSELSRYNPLKLMDILNGEENWILAEFIQQSPTQFIDEISSEITGHQFLIPNVRSAK
ncbi:YaaC family protein [Escherichia coli]|uniref:YaaC family protein n=1 Tax=Escherichia coli TaxID=562 RepID=UPI00098BAD85|nr:YaaC family protein [Escherichia coli]EID6506919.1 hypothetical protein [Escherichia coli]EID6508454.1 hypothetical protein [Escherichia coli]EID6512263.1 hypothetical protein [Escherichia coli]EID6512912.1 hypothetical protein [Escherichia coli]NWO74282.1 hypothetical protein [Escherichia coli]